jgi:hypothetical protein
MIDLRSDTCSGCRWRRESSHRGRGLVSADVCCGCRRRRDRQRCRPEFRAVDLACVEAGDRIAQISQQLRPSETTSAAGCRFNFSQPVPFQSCANNCRRGNLAIGSKYLFANPPRQRSQLRSKAGDDLWHLSYEMHRIGSEKQIAEGAAQQVGEPPLCPMVWAIMDQVTALAQALEVA